MSGSVSALAVELNGSDQKVVPVTEPSRSSATGGIWDYISPSRLNLWLRCPLAFKLRYIDGIRSPPTPSLFLGNRVHAALEIFYRHRMLGMTLEAEDVCRRSREGWEAAAAEQGFEPKDGEELERLRDQTGGLVAAYIGKFLGQLPSDEPAPIAVEATLETPLIDPFTGEDLGISLLGITDLIFPSDQGPVIVDFKTAAKAMPPTEMVHEIQLGCYAYLFRELTGKQEAGLEIRSLVKTKNPQVMVHSFSRREERHLRRLFGVIREYLDCLDRGQFSYRPGWTCGMCDYQRECAACGAE